MPLHPRPSSHLSGEEWTVGPGFWKRALCGHGCPHYCSEGPGGAWGGSRTGLQKAFPPEGGGAGPPAPAPARSLRSPDLRDEATPAFIPLPGAARAGLAGKWRVERMRITGRPGRRRCGNQDPLGERDPPRPWTLGSSCLGGRGSGRILLPCLWLRRLSLF